MEELKKLFKKLQSNRFKYKGSYIFDRLIFNVMMFGLFGYLFFVAYSYNFNLDYYQCGGSYWDPILGEEQQPEDCKNPFYKAPSWKNKEYLPPGEYGTKPGPLFKSVFYVTTLGFILAFVLNHFIYNKGKLKKAMEEAETNEENKDTGHN